MRNLTPQQGQVSRNQRERLLGQRGVVVWFTGLSGSGKSTLAYALEHRLVALGRPAYVLDGDNVRRGLNADLGFRPEDRDENLRRVGEVAALFADAGIITIASFISPYVDARTRARQRADGTFVEIYLDVALSVCEQRDPKGLYKKARAGQIPDFTGISAPYEPPAKPELRLDTEALSVEQCVDRVMTYLEREGYIRAATRRSFVGVDAH